jgi:hypothetical protein
MQTASDARKAVDAKYAEYAPLQQAADVAQANADTVQRQADSLRS